MDFEKNSDETLTTLVVKQRGIAHDFNTET